ncbi:MAG: hypothetical protein Q9227_000383 [Pyrenula ochraceoflavens]
MLRKAALATLKRPGRVAAPSSLFPSPLLTQTRSYSQNKKPRVSASNSPSERSSPFAQPSVHARTPSSSKLPPTPDIASPQSPAANKARSSRAASHNEEPDQSPTREGSSDAIASGTSPINPKSPDTPSSSAPPGQEDWSEAQSKIERDASTSETASKPESQPLPDLTQGIPSTLEEELQQAQSPKSDRASLNVTEDPSEPAAGGGGRGGDRGELPRSAYVSSSDRRRNQLARIFYAALAGGTLLGSIWLGRNWESGEEAKKHPEAPSGWGFGLFYNRITERLSEMLSYYKEPAFPKLLPDPDPDPLQRYPFTLVLSMEDLLMHSEWTREHGWRIAKRPGLDYFIRYLSQYYEIVLFTSQPSMTADPVLRKLDPYRVIRFPLFREATLYKNGEYVKDLAYLNRDLSKVLLVDTNLAHARHQPENAIILPKWKGDPKDQTLIALLPFLEYVAMMGFEDSREVLKSFQGTYIPEEFHRREQALREKFLAEEKSKAPKRRSSGFNFGSAFSSRPKGDGLDDFGPQEGKMIWDQIRERGQKQYQMIDKEIRENGEKWLAEMAAEEKKFQEESMKGMMSGLTGWFGVSKGDNNGKGR